MRDALEANGHEVQSADTATPEQPGEPAEAAAPDGETVPPSEAGKPEAQETQAAPPVPPAEPNEDRKDPSRGHFKSKLNKLEHQVQRLADELDNERGDKTRLRDKLAAAEQELAKLKPVDSPQKVEGPARPKRPKLEDFDFDQAKYDAAMDEHEDRLSEYNRVVLKAQIDTERRAEEAAAKAKAAEEADAKALKAFSDLVQADVKHLDDYRALAELMPEQPVAMPPAVEAVIEQSKRPALLIHYFMKDFLEDEATEINRLAGLSQIEQIWEMKQIESRLVAEHDGKKAKPGKEATTVAEIPAAVPKPEPVSPKTKPVVTPPIATLGSRSASTTDTLAKASSAAEYMRLRAHGVNR